MLAFSARMFKDKFKTFLIYSVSAIGLLEMYIALFPAIRKQAGQFEQILKTFPPDIFKAMNMDSTSMSFSTLESYLSTEYMSFLWPILAIVFAISMANYIFANELDKGTIETLLSLPAKRIKIFFERYLTGLVLIAGFCAFSIMSAMMLAQLHNIDYIFNNFLTATIGSFVFMWAVYSLGILSTVVFSEKGRSTMVASGVLILMYVVNIISSLNTDLENLRYFSFFNYFNGSELLAKNAFPEYMFIGFSGAILLTTIFAAVRFSKRDLSV